MKKIIILVSSSVILIVIAICSIVFISPSAKKTTNAQYLRIHIRANSNSEEDQAIKYKVKEKIVEYLTPYIANSTNIDEAISCINANIKNIRKQANDVLNKNGFNYTSKAEIRTEQFPTRNYGNVTLDKGEYQALIIELGSGTGDNWWCVMFPPLCFIGSENTNNQSITYKSKLYEIIKKYS